jgi:uncharacterized Zn finger protein
MAAVSNATATDVHRDLTGDEARALTETMCVVEDDPECFDDHEVAVYSGSTRYHVNPVVGFCTCPSDQYHSGPCKHRERVAFARGEKPIPAWVDRDRIDPLLLRRLDDEIVSRSEVYGGTEA